MKSAKKVKELSTIAPLESKPESHEFLKNGLSSTAFIISCFSGISYLVASNYQQAYLRFFGVDEQFVELSVERVVLTLSVILTILILCYISLNLVLKLPRMKSILALFRFDFFAVAVTLTSYLLAGVTWYTVYSLVIVALMLLNHFVGVLRKILKGDDWKIWFQEWGKSPPKRVRTTKDLDDHLIERIGFFRWATAVAAITILPGLGSLAGYSAARSATKFESYVVDGFEYILVGQKGETWLFAQVIAGKSTGKTLLARSTFTPAIVVVLKKFESGIEPVGGRAKKPTFSEWWSSFSFR